MSRSAVCWNTAKLAAERYAIWNFLKTGTTCWRCGPKSFFGPLPNTDGQIRISMTTISHTASSTDACQFKTSRLQHFLVQPVIVKLTNADLIKISQESLNLLDCSFCSIGSKHVTLQIIVFPTRFPIEEFWNSSMKRSDSIQFGYEVDTIPDKTRVLWTVRWHLKLFMEQGYKKYVVPKLQMLF